MDGWNHPNISISPLLFVKSRTSIALSSFCLCFDCTWFPEFTSSHIRGPQVESLVSLSWCIRRGTRGEGDGDADYLPPTGVH